MPVSRMQKFLKRGNYAIRVGANSGVYLAGVLQYLVSEVLELASKAAAENKKSRITPRHVVLAVRSDEELDAMMADVTISAGGVMPHIARELLPAKMPTVSHDVSSQEY